MIWCGPYKEGSLSVTMREIDIQDHARKLFEALGHKAIAEVAQKARVFEEQGNNEEADTWRRVEKALLVMRGPHAT
jgi:hypothetical protein